jgi:hypothetical protein
MRYHAGHGAIVNRPTLDPIFARAFAERGRAAPFRFIQIVGNGQTCGQPFRQMLGTA